MNRPYTVSRYKELVKKLRKSMPDLNLSTDVIVGFPGESKQQFKNYAIYVRRTVWLYIGCCRLKHIRT